MDEDNIDEVEHQLDVMTLWSLPWDDIVFSHILPYLDLRSLFVLSSVCKSLRYMIHSYFKTIREVNVRNNGPKLSTYALMTLLGKLEGCQKFVLRNCKSSLTDNILIPALERNDMLRHVDISNCTSLTNHCLQILAISCNRLAHLSIQNCVWASPEAVTNVTLHCNALQNVDLSGCWHMTDDAVCTLCAACPRLKTLNLSRIYGITDKSIIAVAKDSQLIQQLNIRDCWRVTDDGIWYLIEYAKNLKLLQIKGCRSITRNTIRNLAERNILSDCGPPKQPMTLLVQRSEPPVQV